MPMHVYKADDLLDIHIIILSQRSLDDMTETNCHRYSQYFLLQSLLTTPRKLYTAFRTKLSIPGDLFVCPRTDYDIRCFIVGNIKEWINVLLFISPWPDVTS